MGWRFQKRIRIAPGVRLNVSRAGISTTIGPKGLSVNTGGRGTYLNAGLPGTGLSTRTRLDGDKDAAGHAGGVMRRARAARRFSFRKAMIWAAGLILLLGWMIGMTP